MIEGHSTRLRHALITSAVLTLALVGCKKNRFPGYTYSGAVSGTAIFYSASSVRRLDDGNTIFRLLLQNSDETYVIETVVSDCANRFQTRGGTLYSGDGTMLKNVETESDLDKYNFPRIPHVNQHPQMAAVLLGSCKASATQVPVQIPPLKGEFSTAGALESLYGNFHAETGTASWKYLLVPERPPFLYPNYPNEGVGFDASAGTVRVIWDWPFRQHAADKHFVVTATQPESALRWDCHACPFLIGAFVFSRQQGKWSLESGEKYLALGGAFGNTPKPRWIPTGPDNYQVLLDDFDGRNWTYTPRFSIVVDGKKLSVSPITRTGA